MQFSYLEIRVIRKPLPFCLKVIFFVAFGCCHCILNKALEKVHSNRLISYDPKKLKKKWSALINEP